jgi:putative membrane protein
MRTLFAVIKSVLFIALFVILLGFAVKNSDPIVVRYFLGFEWQAPLVFILLVFFAAGVGIGAVASLGIVVRQKRMILRLKRDLRSSTRVTTASMLGQPA